MVHLMSPSILAIVLVVVVGFLWSYIHSRLTGAKKQPPGPRALPVIGHLHLLGNLPHQTLAHLAKKYGALMSLKLGSEPTIVVSSPEAAELILKTHDAIFATRPKLISTDYIYYGGKAVSFTPYGSYWRNVRKLCNMHLLGASKVESFAPIRRENLEMLIGSLRKSVAESEVVDLTLTLSQLLENITYKMVLGRNKDDEFDIMRLVAEGSVLAGAFNISDYVPYLRPLDLQGLERRLKAFSQEMDKLLEKILNEHDQEDGKAETRRNMNFIDTLVSLMNQPMNPNDEASYLVDRTNIKGMLMDMVLGAFETSATSVVWIFSELLRHPRVMKCVQEELESVIGMKRMVEETDLTKLNYLDMVIKETYRLHPVGPLLLPRESMEDIEIDRYHISKKTRIIVNTWAMGRDPKVWSSNVNEFLPERFASAEIDLKGHQFQLLPFGSGQRRCAGMQLGLTTVRLITAQLVHCFNWELPYGILPSDLDMTEKSGLAVPKANHLLAIPTSYRIFS
ncbi:cytochrome P450 CYP736A12-like protein [Tripterygium wilfordii]|uniref:Cytochrome P450 CYP736A12-like protein n=1 Tax=Tripterygium wilfordii TaxID=458696 RepID=A0A7J7BZ51_TRIWF|nr:cytochrome P450 CYP736A12-like [Tripterygium wilfordii]KAF5726907.1 cytochrome P450 CYP736A12-like protein [Tripterygium wilfordii]